MSLQLQMEKMPDYLAARFTGVGVAEEVWRQFKLIAEHCSRAKGDKLLIDITRAEGEVSVIEKYLAAEESQIFARYGIKVAFIEKPERMDPRRFFLVAARNRGVNVEAFTDFQSAEEWLLK
jgi:NOL1/NOP2/fmu family ribosome biogenesis protein